MLWFASSAIYSIQFIDVVKYRYTGILPTKNKRFGQKSAIHQILPNMDYGDAISNQVISLKRILRSQGYRSNIFARYSNSRMVHECKRFNPKRIKPDDIILYHHSISSDLSSFIIEHPGLKILVYHNITPHTFFEPYDAGYVKILREGREELKKLSDYFDLAVGDSKYNTTELKKLGYRQTSVLPIIVDPSKWDFPPDRRTIAALNADENKNIIFVGRLAPNKKQDDLIRMFTHLHAINPETKLWLIGPGDVDSLYVQELHKLIRNSNLEQAVFITGAIDDATLHAYYRTADLFVSMSEHEGFGVPLIEAMWFDIPVLAYRSSAVPETMGESGVVFSDKTNLKEIAELADKILRDEKMRDSVVISQRKVRSKFQYKNLEETYRKFIKKIDNARKNRSANQPFKNLIERGAKNKPKIAFVVPRCGEEVVGGAETLCLQVAKALSDHCSVDVLTTCALDYITWENDYPEGVSKIDSVNIIRFKVDAPRNIRKFNAFSNRIAPKISNINDKKAEKWMRLQGPISSSLLNYINESKGEYDRYFFIPYLYATSFFGLPLVSNKAILIPAAHDEWPMNLPIWNEWYKKPQKIICSTVEEMAFLENRFPGIESRCSIIGLGVNIPDTSIKCCSKKNRTIESPYLLYLGRIDESKGCGELFDFFLKFKARHDIPLKLVLAGKEVMEVPQHGDIISLGYVDEEEKFRLIAESEFVVNASPYESLSIVLLEAWSLNKPVLVTEKSEVMVGQSQRSGGGLWYSDYNDFEKKVLILLEDEQKIAINSREFVRQHYSWDSITKKYLELIT